MSRCEPVDEVVRTGDQGRDVGRHLLGGAELPPSGGAGGGAIRRRGVGHDLPAGRRLHGEGERRLQVGLVEAREDPVGVERLELGVEVDGPVDRVDEAVQADAGVLVGVLCHHDDLVLGRQAADPEPTGVGVEGIGGDGRAVDGGRDHPHGRQVEERLSAPGSSAPRHRRRVSLVNTSSPVRSRVTS